MSAVSEQGATWNFPFAQVVQSLSTAFWVLVHGVAWYCQAPAVEHSAHTVSWYFEQALDM